MWFPWTLSAPTLNSVQTMHGLFAVACKKLQVSHLIPSYSFSASGPLDVNVHKVYIARAEYANVSGSEHHHLRVSFAREAIFFAESGSLVEHSPAN